jgi:radical SAM superfamily enzyme YgiQ (UPF0313 family)
MEGLRADIGVIGEGEITVRELADALEKNEDLAGVDGAEARQPASLHLPLRICPDELHWLAYAPTLAPTKPFRDRS